MTDSELDVLLDISFSSDRLQIAAMWSRTNWFDDWVDVEVRIAAYPFSGTIKSVIFGRDLVAFRNALASLEAPARVQLAGDRGLGLVLDIEQTQGWHPETLAVEVIASPTEDDPWPQIRYLLHQVDPAFATPTVEAIDSFLRTKPTSESSL